MILRTINIYLQVNAIELIFLLPLLGSFPKVHCVISVPQPILIFSLFLILTLEKFAAMDSLMGIQHWLGHSESYFSCLRVSSLCLTLDLTKL